MDQWLELARGPIFQFAFLFMVLGLLRHLVLTIVNIGIAIWRASDRRIPLKAVAKATIEWLMPIGKLRGSVLFSITSFIMHIGLILVPVFLFSHIALWKRGLGIDFALPSMGLAAADLLTLVTIATIFAILAMRIVGRDARELSRFEDYAILVLLAVPFISGYLALHPAINPFAYSATMLVHVMGANLIMVLMPLTKLTHAVLMPTTQLVAELGWHFPMKSGENVCIALHKEEEPV